MLSRTLVEDNMGPQRKRNDESLLEISQPQRIELPTYFNTPRRYNSAPRAAVKKPETAPLLSFRNAKFLNLLNEKSLISDKRLTVMKRLKDYKLLAFACKRAGKARDEGRAHYSIGVLYDNLGNYHAAIQSYQQFLAICKSIGDTHGEALAYNCIGVDYQMLSEQDQLNPAWIRESINYHTKHKDIADVPGKFIAHINLGILYHRSGDVERASISNQFALRYAIQMSSVAGQSVAIGNLGQIGTYKLNGDSEKMKMFVERYLTLSNELRNRKGESGAYLQLGNLSFSQGDYGESSKQFYKAMKIAEELGDDNLIESARCNFGVANANMKMKDHIGAILGKLQP